jgi:hypothetical protein
MEWLGSHTLKITATKIDQITQELRESDGVSIIYALDPSDGPPARTRLESVAYNLWGWMSCKDDS